MTMGVSQCQRPVAPRPPRPPWAPAPCPPRPAADPCGVYFGTRSGKLFASADEGASWQTVAEGLPPIVAVKAAVV